MGKQDVILFAFIREHQPHDKHKNRQLTINFSHQHAQQVLFFGWGTSGSRNIEFVQNHKY